jgi:nucleotide-binding universal stress UspA family protein
MASIATIVVHLAMDSRCMDRLDAAIILAQRFGAHLTVVYGTAPVHMPAGITGRGASYAYLAEAHARAQERAAELEAHVRQSCTKLKSWDWVVDESEHGELIARYARLADLAIVGQDESHTLDDLIALEEPERAALLAGCPVLVLPARGGYDGIGKRVLVAWKESREAVRAVREALPFLKLAEAVHVVTVDPPKGLVEPLKGLQQYLSRHGIASSPRVVADGGDVGETLIDQARTLECDLIVMGAYGHSRVREFLFGGATHHILRVSPCAVLTAH